MLSCFWFQKYPVAAQTAVRKSRVASRTADKGYRASSCMKSGVQGCLSQARVQHRMIPIPDPSTLHFKNRNGGDVAFDITFTAEGRRRRGVRGEVGCLGNAFLGEHGIRYGRRYGIRYGRVACMCFMQIMLQICSARLALYLR